MAAVSPQCRRSESRSSVLDVLDRCEEVRPLMHWSTAEEHAAKLWSGNDAEVTTLGDARLRLRVESRKSIRA
eukprot:6204302-Pleurochrysis_carterae.AAC.2